MSRTSLSSLVHGTSLVVCVGPGGVGKTTVSAALALSAAVAGRKALVLTIDPARRLVDALGLADLGDAFTRVTLPADVPGELHAAMVDTEASWLGLVARIVPESAMRQRILDNRVFRAMSRSMARSHAYVAMERLYEAVEHGGFDLVVLDTPPARNALEVLDAPTQLVRFLDARIIGWLLPTEPGRGLAGRLLARGGAMAKQLLSSVTGEHLLGEILGFLGVFAELREGFEQRARRVESLLREPSSGFVLVSSASAASIDDAAWLRDDLERRGVGVQGVVFNQSYVPVDLARPDAIVRSLPTDDAQARSSRLRPHLADDGSAALLSTMRALREQAVADNLACDRTVAGLVAELPTGSFVVRVPRFDDEIRDIEGLRRLATAMLGAMAVSPIVR